MRSYSWTNSVNFPIICSLPMNNSSSLILVWVSGRSGTVKGESSLKSTQTVLIFSEYQWVSLTTSQPHSLYYILFGIAKWRYTITRSLYRMSPSRITRVIKKWPIFHTFVINLIPFPHDSDETKPINLFYEKFFFLRKLQNHSYIHVATT